MREWAAETCITSQVLIADFFFVCIALAWLVAGVAAKASLDNSVGTGIRPCSQRHLLWLCAPSQLHMHIQQWFPWRSPVCLYLLSCTSLYTEEGVKHVMVGQALLDAWYPLWQWVFQPAIGVLMLGAVMLFLHMLNHQSESFMIKTLAAR